ncbi:peptidoglycan lytic exotransglycosylase [Hypericibacter adhaerens]|jgi:membrane-bound lytic murein transglycosylase MltF|uniref:Peptidoglycan lytic exotransglycosylase n=1 Tax=Hypericibacter adhaerens TaxID=2602016 RepID=A0A5J6N5S8_9PROT|nr:peptidoglycan lytic exotransglycosylase [Hypericibacter adhaerens]
MFAFALASSERCLATLAPLLSRRCRLALPKSLLAAALVALAMTLAPAARAAMGTDETAAPPESAEEKAVDALVQAALKPWKGDFDEMVKRRFIRVLTTYNRINYFTDKYRERGVTYDTMKIFEDELNKKLGLKLLDRVHVIFLPVSRDRLISGLEEGIGDIAAANLTITDDRLKHVDFSTPFADTVKEVLITGPGSPPIATIDDLSGKEVVVRQSSSYYESLLALNEKFKAAGKPEVTITLADEDLEDDAIAEMVNADLYPAMVMDEHKAKLWSKVFTNIKVHPDITLREGGQIAWAIRKDSPKLMAVVDDFVSRHKVGTSMTNQILKRYLVSTQFVKNANADAERKKFNEMVGFFRKYSDQYHFDWLMMIAQGYQESRLDQSAKNPSGALGIMQVLPTTAAGNPINIPNITVADRNIEAGIKYMRFMVDEYFNDPAINEVNRHLFAFAGYNCGPNRLDRLRKKAAEQGLDPNKWFNNVEVMVARSVGQETVNYVSNIFKYFVAYKRIEDQRLAIEAAKQQATEQGTQP